MTICLIIVHFTYYLAHVPCMTWHVKFVHSKDVQKKLVQTFLIKESSSIQQHCAYSMHTRIVMKKPADQFVRRDIPPPHLKLTTDQNTQEISSHKFSFSGGFCSQRG